MSQGIGGGKLGCAVAGATVLVGSLVVACCSPASAAWAGDALAAKPGALVAVSMRTPADGWAVGTLGAAGDGPLAEHWDGARWRKAKIAKTPGVAALTSVSAVGASDVWVAGSNQKGATRKTLVEHWNGSAWTRLSTDNPADLVNHLDAVSADSATDAWAVGYSETSGGVVSTLVERFTGSAWHQVASYDPGDDRTVRVLRAVQALSPTDVWAVGDFTPSGEGRFPLIERWNGSKWKETPPPNPEGSVSTTLYAVGASTATDAWAVGTYRLSGSNEQTLIEHWDGTTWTIVPSPNGSGTAASRFTGVSVISAADAWASGVTMEGGKATPLLAHWNGTDWTRVKAPSVPGAYGTTPVAISVDQATDGWTVGSYAADDQGTPMPLFERWNGTKWRLL
jgi:hypothetical protein